jgi:hypothetical protein
MLLESLGYKQLLLWHGIGNRFDPDQSTVKSTTCKFPPFQVGVIWRQRLNDPLRTLLRAAGCRPFLKDAISGLFFVVARGF